MSYNNLIATLDFYKFSHKDMYPDNTQVVYSYFESRTGAAYPYTVFFGLQYLIKKWLTTPVTKAMVDEAQEIADNTFDVPGVFDRSGWDYIVDKLGGKLPLVIKAVKEGTVVAPNSNVLLTVENTDPNCWWLTNAIETLLSHVWASSAVCTRSHYMINILKKAFAETSDNEFLAPYFNHDFSQRGVSSMESASILGAAHLVNTLATDTCMGVKCAHDYYNAPYKGLSFSVRADEHSIASAMGEAGEVEQVKKLLQKFPNGIYSRVSDSFSIKNMVQAYCNELKSFIITRNGKFVIRPDSPRFAGDTISSQILWLVETLWSSFGGTVNSKGYKVLDSHVGVIYGDSVTEKDLEQALDILRQNRFSAENCVFGCGSYLSQKINRDTQRMAFKCSAQQRNGIWFDVQKKPLDVSKASKTGRLKLVRDVNGKFLTVGINDPRQDELVEVFRNGELLVDYTFDQVRQNARVS